MSDLSYKKFLPKEKAGRLLSDLEIESLDELDIEWIAYKRGATVIYDRIEGAEARLNRSNKKGLITVSNEITDRARVRFNIAHELGHYELHKNEETLTICSDDELTQWYQTQLPLELSANVFAAELLLPEKIFKPLIKKKNPSFEVISDLASKFNTSIMATAKKFIDHTDQACCLFISKDKKITQFGRSTGFPYWVHQPGTKLDQDSEAFGYFEKGFVNIARPTQISADAWISDEKVNPDSLILEDTFPIPNYQTVLSLVWINEPIEKDDYSNEGRLRDLDPDDDLSPSGRKRGFY